MITVTDMHAMRWEQYYQRFSEECFAKSLVLYSVSMASAVSALKDMLT